MPTDLTRKYVAEFARILQPEGLLVFQLPARFVLEKVLPADAFWADISLLPHTLRLQPASPIKLNITVQNLSLHPWSYNPPFTIALGNHWLGPHGSLLIKDDGRALLHRGVFTWGKN